MLENCKFGYKLKNKQLPNKTLALCYLDSKNKSFTKQHNTTVEEFSNSKLAADYYIETVNITCSKYENKNHLFDELASFCGYDNIVYLQLDMLNHVAENTSHYE